MEQSQIDEIKHMRDTALRLVVEITPGNNVAELDAMEKLFAVHKHLRQIDYSKLGQLALLPQEKYDKPAEPVPCPVCGGTGQVVETVTDDAESGTTHLVTTACPKCLGTGKIPAQAKLEDLSEAGSPTFQAAMRDEAPGPVTVEQEDRAADKIEEVNKVFDTMGTERDRLEAERLAAAGGSALPDLSKLHVKVGMEGGRHLIHLDGVSCEGKQLRATLVKVLQKAGLIERPGQLTDFIKSSPDSEGRDIAMAIDEGSYGKNSSAERV